MLRHFAISAVALVVLGAACAAPPEDLAPPPPTTEPESETESGSTKEPEETAERTEQTLVPATLLEAMVAEVASDTGVDPDQIVVAMAEEITWNDSSLGCREPGQMYLQALTPGYQVILEAGGQEFDYRANMDGFFKRCS